MASDKETPSNFLDIDKIMQLLPHDYPFLLVDRVVSWDGETLCALKNVTYNEPFFQGHFPGRPIMPGVMIMEALGQTCGILMFMEEDPDLSKPRNSLFFVVGLDKVRFRRAVTPGDQLVMHASIEGKKGPYYIFNARAKVGDELVTEAVIRFMLDKNG